jgi:hypothetical protein
MMPIAVPLSTGITGDETRLRLEKFVQALFQTRPCVHYAGRRTKFWAPVPWMLESAIVLDITLGKYVEAAIIAVLVSSWESASWPFARPSLEIAKFHPNFEIAGLWVVCS